MPAGAAQEAVTLDLRKEGERESNELVKGGEATKAVAPKPTTISFATVRGGHVDFKKKAAGD